MKRKGAPSAALDDLSRGMDKRRFSPLTVIALLTLAIVCFLYLRTGSTTKYDTRYGLMFDAGSTGSRIHVYSFDGNGKLLDEIFEEVKPGLSSYPDSEAAANSLKPLFDIAVKSIPSRLHKCTPMALKATAGLRMLGAEQANAHLDAVRNFMRRYAFYMREDGAEIMDGADEGVYAWITVNYLLGRLNNPSRGGARNTVSIMDLGGGSTQIVFEPHPNSMRQAPNVSKYSLQFGDKKYELYQHSYEPFGLMRAREAMLRDGAVGSSIEHVCVPKGHKEIVKHISNGQIELIPHNDGGFQKCLAHARRVLNKNKACEVEPCSFNGVFQPDISNPDVFSNDMYAFSYFYDRTQIDGSRPEITLDEIRLMAEKACSGPATDAAHGALCTDLSYIYALLTDGYSLKKHHKLMIAKKINGIETSWALGAMVTLMKNAKLTCER